MESGISFRTLSCLMFYCIFDYLYLGLFSSVEPCLRPFGHTDTLHPSDFSLVLSVAASPNLHIYQLTQAGVLEALEGCIVIIIQEYGNSISGSVHMPGKKARKSFR